MLSLTEGTASDNPAWNRLLDELPGGYEELKQRSFRAFYSLSKSEAANLYAEDFVQDAILHLYLMLQGFDPEDFDSLTAWAMTVVKNSLRNNVHRSPLADPLDSYVEDECQDTHDHFERLLDSRVAIQLVESAPDELRPVLKKIARGERLTRTERRRFAQHRPMLQAQAKE